MQKYRIAALVAGWMYAAAKFCVGIRENKKNCFSSFLKF